MNSLRFLHKLCYLWCISLILSSVNAQPVNWSSSTSYSIGDLVFNAQTSYIAIQPSINIHPTNISYWANLNKAAQALDIPVEEVPSLPVNTILNALPNSIPSNSHIISVSTFPPFGGVIVGNLEVLEGNSTTLNAIPSTGYLFARWSGDINGTASSLSLSVNSALTISAHFTPDFNDSDGDGLSNYEEAQLGSNLNEVNTDLATYISSVKANARVEGNASGIAFVKQNPSVYGLVNEEELNASIASAFSRGKLEGTQSVLSDPTSFDLVSRSFHEDTLEQFINSADRNSTPYTKDWFYVPKSNNSSNEYLVIELATGPVVIELFHDIAPLHVARMKALALAGKFDRIAFHRVIEGFMAQTGDIKYGSQSGYDSQRVGTGGSDLPDLNNEFNSRKHLRGTCSMARSSNPNSANSQFFICFQDSPFLDGQYTVWGQVIEGMNFVDQIKKGSSTDNGSVSNPEFMQKVYLHDLTSNSLSGWFFTNRTLYPYFYHSSTRNWIYFHDQSSQANYYHYGSKKWFKVD